MNTMKNLSILILLFLAGTLSISAQNKGMITGTVTDLDEGGEPLPFAHVLVQEHLDWSTKTDFDGKYTLNLPEGTYEIVFRAPAKIDQKQTVEVKAGEEVVLDMELSNSFKVFTKVAEKKIANDDQAVINEKKNETKEMDGTSNKTMKDAGDSDAGAAVQRVSGVSVVEGKHVFVRGLGDRYTKTIFNGMEIPGLDPDRNSVQMDIFPTNIIDNIAVFKSFSPDLSGDFTGGLIDIRTKDFPTKRTLSFSAGYGYNTVATFNNNFLLYNGGKLDFLGFDDGSRALPVSVYTRFPDPALNDASLTNLTRAFGSEMSATNQANFLNQSYSLALGNKKDSVGKNNMVYGYNYVLNYRSSYTFYEDVQFNEYRKDQELDETEIYIDRRSQGTMGQYDVMWSAMVGQSLKINEDNKLSLSLFRIQNGQSSAANLAVDNYEANVSSLGKQSLQYTQRSVTNALLKGEHRKGESKDWKIEWRIAPTLSTINDPDIRSTVLEKWDDGNYYLNPSVGSEIRRMFRDLSERNVSSKVDFTRDYEFKGSDSLASKFKFGVMETYKVRDFRVLDYIFNLENMNGFETMDPNFFFAPENIWTVETDQGTYARGERQLANTFSSSQNILAAYAMNEMQLTPKFQAVYGLRAEKAVNRYTGQNNSGSVIYNNEKVLDELDFLPALNMKFTPVKEFDNTVNFRGSYSMTVARPSFREISVAQIYDPIQGRRYNGNINLVETHIHNAGVRWEKFYGGTGLLSFSGFYKRLNNPIEIVAFETAPSEVQPINAGVADLAGFEAEIRKNIGLDSINGANLEIGTNLTLVQSRIDMSKVMISKGDDQISEWEIRQNNARIIEGTPEVIDQYRPMFGQSPYMINAFLKYTNDSLGITANVSYNVQGKRLAVVGIGRIPDVYEQPFHSLNFKASKKFGTDKQWKCSLSANNILGSAQQKMYESYLSTSQIYSRLYSGRTFSLSIGYTL